MFEPSDLLAQAARLAAPQRGAPRQTDLARAISAAYYALFHHLLGQMADELVGKAHKSTPEYELVYRSVNHGSLAKLCDDATKSPLPAKYRRIEGLPQGFSSRVQICATALTELQEKRHQADYAPRARFLKSDVLNANGQASSGISAINNTDENERRVFLYLMAFAPRS